MMDATEANYASLSELESLSDSDWLDIASSRASEDNDSVAGFDDSDREDTDDRPPSRRSSNSAASSRDGVVEGWEGLLEDSSDESPSEHTNLLANQPTAHGLDAAADVPLTSGDEAAEDERVKAALDQSMMSTLSSSRSNSLAGSMQTSIVHSSRDLRLSFPDPLTSSRDELLNRSYEEVSPPDADPTQSDITHTIAASSSEDSGSITTPDIRKDTHSDGWHSVSTPDFCVFLYGSSLVTKSVLIEGLLHKWACASGLAMSATVKEAPGVQTFTFISATISTIEKAMRRSVSVIDKTDRDLGNNPWAKAQLDCPSLAVIFLPSTSHLPLLDHTLYLPVVPSQLVIFDLITPTDAFLDAEQQWETFGISPSKLTTLSHRSSPVVDQETLEQATSMQLHNAFRPLVPKVQRKAAKGIGSPHAIAILTVLSVVLGCVVGGAFRAAGVTASVDCTPPSPLWGLLRPIHNTPLNKSSAPIAPTAASNATTSSSSKDVQVAIFSSATLSIATTSAAKLPSPLPSTAASGASRNVPTECGCGCGLITWPGKIESTDLILRPTPSSLALSTNSNVKAAISHFAPQPQVLQGKGKARAHDHDISEDTSLYAISTRLAGSLSEYFDFKTVFALVNQDMQELMDALDQLAHAIGRQTAVVWEQSRGAVSVLRDTLQERNSRARERARQLRDMGMQFLSSVGERMRGRAELARDNAKAIRQRIVDNEARKAFRARRKEAFSVRKMKRRERRQARREAKQA